MFSVMSVFKTFGMDDTALGALWSESEYLRWQREQEERDEVALDAANARALSRFDPECEAAVRALEEGGWGAGCKVGLGRR